MNQLGWFSPLRVLYISSLLHQYLWTTVPKATQPQTSTPILHLSREGIRRASHGFVSSRTPILSADACFYRRVEGEACGVLIPAGITAAQQLFAIKQAPAMYYSLISPQCSLPPVLCWYRAPWITSLACELYIAALSQALASLLSVTWLSRLPRMEIPSSKILARVLCCHQFPSLSS